MVHGDDDGDGGGIEIVVMQHHESVSFTCFNCHHNDSLILLIITDKFIKKGYYFELKHTRSLVHEGMQIASIMEWMEKLWGLACMHGYDLKTHIYRLETLEETAMYKSILQLFYN